MNNKMTKQDFKLKRKSKGRYVAEGYHNGKYWEVECENRASLYKWADCVKGWYVDVYCDGKYMYHTGGVGLYRLGDVRWQLANNRDNFLIED